MNLPNKLTLLRVILIPPMVWLLLLAAGNGDWLFWLIGGLLYGAAAVTDAFDGNIARKRGLVTDFGKLMDPVADKLLVCSVFVCFVAQGLCSPWILIIVLLREFLVMSVRTVAAARGTVIPANKWGKAKTITQMTAIVVVMLQQLLYCAESKPGCPLIPPVFGEAYGIPYSVGQATLWLSAAITLVSGAVYVWQSRELFKDIK